jgi:hypothetical protein
MPQHRSQPGGQILFRVGPLALALVALAALIIADPFSGPQTNAQRLEDARKSGGKSAELWLVNFDIATAAEAYVREHGFVPGGITPIRPHLKKESYEFLLQPGNSARWAVNRPGDLVDAQGPINLEIEVFSGKDRVWESYLIKRQNR